LFKAQCFGDWILSRNNTKRQADKHARKKQQNKTRKIEHENTYGNVQKRNQLQDTEKTSEADSFKNMRVITSYTPEDGHIGRNI
jgi:hypothetical protein